MKTSIFILGLLLAATNSFGTSVAKTNKVLFQFGSNVQAVKNADHIVFYGYDCALYRYTVRKKDLMEFRNCDKLPDALTKWMYNEYPAHKIRRRFDFKEVDYNLTAVQLISKDKACLTTEKYSITEDQIRQQVASYKLPETDKKGVGFVVIPENLNRRSEYATAYLVFFDLDTREILYGGHVYANQSHGRFMRARFGKALWKCMKRFDKVMYSEA